MAPTTPAGGAADDRPDRRQADWIIAGVPVYGAPDAPNGADAVAVRGGQILSIGRRREVERFAGPDTRTVLPARGCVVPGLIDGHAHLDREGLKTAMPTLDGAETRAQVVERIAAEAARRRPGEWIVTLPIGTAPGYDRIEGFEADGYPDRRDLDRAAPHNPVYIRPIWGYWRKGSALVSIANSRALALAGVDRDTRAPSDEVAILRDADGEPTGVFLEDTLMSVVELTLMAAAPNFSFADRLAGLGRSMAAYNSFGTTAIYEGHGVAPEVVRAWQTLARDGRQTVRATLVFSPSFGGEPGAPAALVRDWAKSLAGRGIGDEMLRMQGIYAEIDEGRANWVRAAAAPQTGWAGFNYDCGLPRQALKEVLIEAARLGLRASGIYPYILGLFDEVHRVAPIDRLRWAWGHISLLSPDDVARTRDLGLVLVTHTNRHLYKVGAEYRSRLGAEREDDIVPLRRLIDAGVPVSFGTDNVPPSLFHPIQHAVTRRAAGTGEVIAPGQRISRAEALSCATRGGAYACGQEDHVGVLAPGMRADLAILDGDLMTVQDTDLAGLSADLTMVDGRVVHDRAGYGA